MKNKTKLKSLTVATIAGLQFVLPALATDDATTPPATTDNSTTSQAAEIDALKKEVRDLAQKLNALESQQSAPAQPSASYQDLDQKVKILERERENDKDDAAALAKTQPKISLSANGFSFGSADSNFVATLHGLIQLDSRTFFGDHGKINNNDSFLLRRARPVFTGTVFHDFDFNFTPDFGGSTANGANPVQIVDAYLNYRYNPALQLEVGKFKSPVGLEQLQADAVTSFNERSIVNDLVPNRDLGVELHGDLLGGTLSYAAGIFDGAPDYSGTTFNQDSDDNKAFAGRLFAQPWKNSKVDALKGLGFGVGGSYQYDSKGTPALTSGYKTDGQQNFFTYASTAQAEGTHWRVSPQAYYYYGPLSLLGEYVISDQHVYNTAPAPGKGFDLQNTAWEISGGWVLTGEDAGYTGVTPRSPFNLRNGQWGAWQVVARYADVDVDNDTFTDGLANPLTAASEARAWSVGLNWYLNKNIRVNTSFSHTSFTGGHGPTATVTAYPENVLFTRIQLAF
jgi:phosphate-selective porin OprO and OprP